ncbi:polynucleotide adenylyltransferase PcnB [Granulosicoccaceae sp. 1_MG-2023]|nr:polynucleotide adenylyltransferase PcnB [Granulosicoccaceae sp. 1_MG-2023]
MNSPNVVPYDEHRIDVQKISGNALTVLDTLNKAGFEAYLVGGGVRDLLLGQEPKDFDISTSASPDQIRELFRNCRLIGRRFRLAHILFGREVIEVATFRAHHEQGEGGETEEESGRILRDNVFGTVEDDAIRRDFTINALYYNAQDRTVIDYCGAMQDMQSKTLRMIGESAVRCAEDPVRALRAARFSAKLGFQVDQATREAMAEKGRLLREIPPARLFEEVLKLFHSGHACASFDRLREFDLLQYLFPAADRALKAGDDKFETFVSRALANTDERILSGKPVTPAFLYAVMLWPKTRELAMQYVAEEPPVPAVLMAADEALAEQLQYTSLPKRFSIPTREIWAMQPRLECYIGKRALRLLSGPRFRAGYDFLCLRAGVSPELKERADWWTDIQQTHPHEVVRPEKKRTRTRKPRRTRNNQENTGA